MSNYRLVPRAVSEMDEIAHFTVQRWGRAKAVAYVRTLSARFAWLAENPMLGLSRDDLRPGVRSYRQGSHMIFYRIVDEQIETIGVPHGAVDLEAYFEG